VNETSRIKILPEVVASQIAAGEVVQRPASVVKELLDNSLDAGAGRVGVEIDKGGNARIRVVDDGCGMSREDLPMAIRRHATSKIESEADLLAIQTYGFRGEALAAISSVSRTEIVSRQPSQRQGNRLLAVGGEVQSIEPAASPPGTVVTISDLFFNTPARKKFLKTPTTEMERVSDVFLKAAICQPHLHLELLHNGKKARHLPPAPSIVDRLVQIFGSELVGDLLPVDQTNDRIQISGFTSRPTTHRNTTSDLYFFVNRRSVRDRLLLRALVEAYRASLPQRRYPVAVLFIDLPAEYVDVNVHPSKEEIRFRDERFIWSSLYTAVREALGGLHEFPPGVGASAPWPSEKTREWTSSPEPTPPSIQDKGLKSPPRGGESPPLAWNRESPLPVKPPAPRGIAPSQRILTPPTGQTSDVGIETLNRAPIQTPVNSRSEDTSPRSPEWQAVAQVFDSYIVAEAEGLMAVFDQHALHERLQFEKFRRDYEAHAISQQRLLFPMTLEIPPNRVDLLQESLELLAGFGLEMESFGDTTFVVRGIPSEMDFVSVKGFVEDALQDLAEVGVIAPLSERAEKVLARMACRSAIKAGDPLSTQQMQDLIDRYSNDPALATCPHGRPPVWKITRKELEKWFDRG
jgi:DNA mismatch repair protein MutL